MKEKMRLLLEKTTEAYELAYVSETVAKVSQVEKAFYRLYQKESLLPHDFWNMGISRYSSVIEILRKEHDVPIITEWVKGKLYKYSIPKEDKI